MPFLLFTFMSLSFNISLLSLITSNLYIPFFRFCLSFSFTSQFALSCYLFLLTLSTSFTHHIYSLSFLSYSSQLISGFFCLFFSSSLFRFDARFFYRSCCIYFMVFYIHFSAFVEFHDSISLVILPVSGRCLWRDASLS